MNTPRRRVVVMSSLALITLGCLNIMPTYAANGTWNCTADGANGFWTNNPNRSSSSYLSGADRVLFISDGSGQSTVDLAGLPAIKYVTFDTASVGVFTFGTGAVNSQTFNSGVQPGADQSSQVRNLRNENLSQPPTMADAI